MDNEGATCTGGEDIKGVETEFLDLSNLRPEYNVYKAVYALAYALNDMLLCEPVRGPFRGHSCANLQNLEPWQVWYQLTLHLYASKNHTDVFISIELR